MKRYTLTWILVGFIYATALVALSLIVHQGDLSFFANVSPRYLSGDTTIAWGGYDGQFAYFVARDPLNAIPHLDSPVYRFQRILYPMLARVLALGQADWVPLTLILVNVLAVAIGTGAFARLLYRERAPAWIPIVYFAWFGIGHGLLYDLYEPTALAFALWGLVLFTESQTTGAGILFGLGALGKDLAFLFSAPAVAWLFFNRQWRAGIQLVALSFSPYLIWTVILKLVMGSWQFEAAAGDHFAGVCLSDPTVPFFILVVLFPAVIFAFAGRRQWNDLYFLMTVATILFVTYLLSDTFCGHSLYRLSTGLILATSLLLARLGERKWLQVCAGAWSATCALAFLVAVR